MSFDFDATKLLVEGYAQENYRKVYSQTNEHLRQLYSNVDFSDKKVLSVAASGDQAFLAYAFGAKHIDLFDINKITLYYYYLRLWTIKYFNKFYPKIPFHKKFKFIVKMSLITKCWKECLFMMANIWRFLQVNYL